MATPISVPRPSDIRDAGLRTVRSGLLKRGVPNPNVTEGTDEWIRWEAFSIQLAIGFANQQILTDQILPDTAEQDGLARHLAIYGIGFRPAQGSNGNVTLNSSAATFIPTGQQLIDAIGNLFEVSIGGTYNNGEPVPVHAIVGGLSTNHQAGEVLQWVAAPAFTDRRAIVATGGLKDGADADTNETARNRLLALLRNPRGGGNWPQVKGWAEQASASVQAAYVYPAINGPATYGVVVVGPLSFDPVLGWTREVTTATVNLVASYVAAQMPIHADQVDATPTDTVSSSPAVDTDVAIGLALPISTAGGGPGGGWVDATPWPALLGTATRVTVQTVTSSTDITLTSDDVATTPNVTGLIAGQTTIAWFSSAAYAAGQDPLVIATVATIVSTTTGHVRITLSTPFTGIVVGDFVMPNAENIQDYARAWLQAMNDMGPGEWSAHADVLVHGRRQPLGIVQNPYSLGGVQLRAITDVGEEVADAAYLYRSTTTPAAGVAVTPGNPASAPPNILVPRRFGFFNKIP